MLNFIPAKPYADGSLSINIYKSIQMTLPTSTNLDCMVYCYNIELVKCEFFFFENKTCFLGSSNFTAGNVTKATFNVKFHLNSGEL
jgi:hypothetical protein